MESFITASHANFPTTAIVALLPLGRDHRVYTFIVNSTVPPTPFSGWQIKYRTLYYSTQFV